MPYGMKRFAFDIDGTLLKSDGTLPHAVAHSLREAERRGMTVTLVSGRPIHSVVDVARQVGLSGPVLGLNGGIISNLKGDILFRQPLSNGELSNILALCAEFAKTNPHLAVNVYAGHRWYTRTLTPDVEDEARILGSVPEVVGDGIYTLRNAEKVVVMGNNAVLTQIAERVKGVAPSVKPDFFLPYFLELAHQDVHKYYGLCRFCELFGFLPNEFVAVGDGGNDLELIEQAGYGVAMGNAKPEVKKVAREVIGTNDEEGVALFMQRLLAKA